MKTLFLPAFLALPLTLAAQTATISIDTARVTGDIDPNI